MWRQDPRSMEQSATRALPRSEDSLASSARGALSLRLALPPPDCSMPRAPASFLATCGAHAMVVPWLKRCGAHFPKTCFGGPWSTVRFKRWRRAAHIAFPPLSRGASVGVIAIDSWMGLVARFMAPAVALLVAVATRERHEHVLVVDELFA
jgi:hypothetical protein